MQREVVDYQKVGADQFPHFGVIAGVEACGFQAAEEPVRPLEVGLDAVTAGYVAEGSSEERFPDTDRDPDRLQQLRSLLPCEVRVTSPTHPLSGKLLMALSFQRRNGVLMLVVTLPDDSRGTIAAAATGVFGESAVEATPAVLSAEGFQHLHDLVVALKGGARKRARPKTRK